MLNLYWIVLKKINAIKLIDFSMRSSQWDGLFFDAHTWMIQIWMLCHKIDRHMRQQHHCVCMNVPLNKRKLINYTNDTRKWYFSLNFTFNLVRSLNPLSQTMHLNRSFDPAVWIFLCFASAFMFVEMRPQIVHVWGPSMWMLFMCERRFSLFLYLKMNFWVKI